MGNIYTKQIGKVIKKKISETSIHIKIYMCTTIYVYKNHLKANLYIRSVVNSSSVRMIAFPELFFKLAGQEMMQIAPNFLHVVRIVFPRCQS